MIQISARVVDWLDGSEATDQVSQSRAIDEQAQQLGQPNNV
jgi:hypothetical protein